MIQKMPSCLAVSIKLHLLHQFVLNAPFYTRFPLQSVHSRPTPDQNHTEVHEPNLHVEPQRN